jgi:hypothetical protein
MMPGCRDRTVGEAEDMLGDVLVAGLVVQVECRFPLDPGALVVRVGPYDGLDQLH